MWAARRGRAEPCVSSDMPRLLPLSARPSARIHLRTDRRHGYSQDKSRGRRTFSPRSARMPSLLLWSMTATCRRRVTACTEEMVQRRLAQFNALPHPLIYTPGDNEWTDCHDGQNVKGGDPLSGLRGCATSFSGRAEPRQAQDAVHFVRAKAGICRSSAKTCDGIFGGVTFVTLHIPGSNNGLGRTPEGDAEYADETMPPIWFGCGRLCACQSE